MELEPGRSEASASLARIGSSSFFLHDHSVFVCVCFGYLLSLSSFLVSDDIPRHMMTHIYSNDHLLALHLLLLRDVLYLGYPSL